jgi:hypothetical protein
MCLYGRPSATRIGILSHLDYNYPTLSHLGCHGNISIDDQRELFELEKLFKYRATSITEFGNLIKKFPLILDNSTTYSCSKHSYFDPVHQLYKDIFVDVVAETINEGDVFFITEKVIRPMIFKKPFIVSGTKNFLIYLRQMGFKTFHDFWDEDYDGFEKGQRFNFILELLDNIASKSTKELQEMYQSMSEILDHNYNLLQTNTFKTDIQKID